MGQKAALKIMVPMLLLILPTTLIVLFAPLGLQYLSGATG